MALAERDKLIATFLILLLYLSQFSQGIHLGKNNFIARSCLDYLKNGVFENGFYWLFDDKYQRYVAYCDLESEPGAAWTLVMSWNRASRSLRQFRSSTFAQDAPINHKTPNWDSYRQTLSRMKSLRSTSTHWRATCSFNHLDNIDYRDYVRGSFSNNDIMGFLGHGQCLLVDYVNIRGHAAGPGTKARFWQVHNTYMLHIDSSHTGCGFVPTAGSSASEDNFGFNQAFNTNFRCNGGDFSTTQWWFGGYLAE